ncbi:hypothetical protein TARUN_10244 [Trichoderma arundinaceum]|uniref:Uncharacterized protein n=1 Tax=Trichoderma arundinaceum TaxID=490622 RepID=A0A395N7B7_TRIAR|nr:hypothetical protein TARUN_10244 [Trichoderma arundinaceum]
MSDTSPNGAGNGHRRSSITQAALSNLFQRGPPTGSSGPPFPGNGGADTQRRRLSISTIGLSGTSPSNTASFMRRGSISTNSDSIDENAIEDEDAIFGGPRTAPTTPFVRHMSFGGNNAMRNLRTGGSPGNGKSPKSPPPPSLGRNQGGHGDQWLPLLSQSHPHQRQVSISAAWPTAAGRRSSLHMPPSPHPQASNIQHPRASSDNPPSRADQFGFNWSEQLRSRAESSVTGARPSFSFHGTGSHSPPRAVPNHDRSKSISDMPQPPAQASAVKPKQQERPKPDAFQERILKGDFYMD